MEGIQILLVAAILPSIVLGWYIYKNDKIEKEPTSLLVKLFLGGLGSIAITLLVSEIIDLFVVFDVESSNSVVAIFTYVFLTVALVEEGSKYIMVRLLTWNSKEYKHVYDGIVYCVFVSLGFATLENILYVLGSYSIWTAIFRAIMAVPGHVFDAIAMGKFYGKAKDAAVNGRMSESRKYSIIALLVPVFFHGLYDSCLFAANLEEILVVIFLIFLIFLYIYSFRTVKKVAKVQTNFIASYMPNVPIMYNNTVYPVNQMNQVPMNGQPIQYNQNREIYCGKCGTMFTGEYCANCGNKRN